MKTEILSIHDPKALALAVEILKSGGLVVFPTDTVYGVGAIAFNDQAVSQISEIKGRSGEKAIPILIGAFDQLGLVSSGVNSDCEKLARRFWPGPLTIVLPRHNSAPSA